MRPLPWTGRLQERQPGKSSPAGVSPAQALPSQVAGLPSRRARSSNARGQERKWKVRFWWPWKGGRAGKHEREEVQRAAERMHTLKSHVKAESLEDLQDILGAMLLSECIYKPHAELIRCMNRYKADFGGDLVRITTVQVSLPHALHRYLLAEGGDTLFASFIGTKKIRDYIADANVLQENIFREDDDAADVIDPTSEVDVDIVAAPAGSMVGLGPPARQVARPRKRIRHQLSPKPAAHRGFLARAKGIPALELYRLAQQSERRLVLCGHSLGGAVAVLTTLAILRAADAVTGGRGAPPPVVKCITFSQPPVGNAALGEYVQRHGWAGHFRSFCIPEDIVPRLLSPAYFAHYHSQAASSAATASRAGPAADEYSSSDVGRVTRGCVSPVTEVASIQALPSGSTRLASRSLWRIPRLAPVAEMPRSLDWFTMRSKAQADPQLGLKSKPMSSASGGTLGRLDAGPRVIEATAKENIETPPGPGEGLGLKRKEAPGLFADADMALPNSPGRVHEEAPVGSPPTDAASGRGWTSRLPSLPSYIPFGQLYLLGTSSAEPLSASEFTRLSSMRSIFAEVRDGFASHTMKSYRTRFQNIYASCVTAGIPFPAAVLEKLPHLHGWGSLGGQLEQPVEWGHVAPPCVIRAATSVVPLGWTGGGIESAAGGLRVEVAGQGLHLLTLARARVNGRWYSATIESAPCPSSLQSSPSPGLQTMRLKITSPLRRAPRSPSHGMQPAPDKPPPPDGKLLDDAASAGAIGGSESPSSDLAPAIPDLPASSSLPAGTTGMLLGRLGGIARFSLRGNPPPVTPAPPAQEEFLVETLNTDPPETKPWAASWAAPAPGEEGAGEVLLECSSDFQSSRKKVGMVWRRVRLLGLEGAGKTSLHLALLEDGGSSKPSTEGVGLWPDLEWREGVAGGVNYVDAPGVSLQDLSGEARQLRHELKPPPTPSEGEGTTSIDAIVLVHNFAHKIPTLRQIPPLPHLGLWAGQRGLLPLPPISALFRHLVLPRLQGFPRVQSPPPGSLTLPIPAPPRQSLSSPAAPSMESSTRLSHLPGATEKGMPSDGSDPGSQRSHGQAPNPTLYEPHEAAGGSGLKPQIPKPVKRSTDLEGSPVAFPSPAPLQGGPIPALAPLLDEARAAGVPILLALTNKHVVSVDRRQQAASAAMEAYKVPPSLTTVVNSRPFAAPIAGGSSRPTAAELAKTPAIAGSDFQSGIAPVESAPQGGLHGAAARLLQAPMSLIWRKETMLPVEGVRELRALVHQVLQENEEAALQQAARLALERELETDAQQSAMWQDSAQAKPIATAAAMGVAVGAGMGAAAMLLVALARGGRL